MLYRTEGLKLVDDDWPHIFIPVYLLADSSIIKTDTVAFSDGNAAHRESRFGRDLNFFNTIDFPTVFHDRAILTNENKDYIVRVRQAEVLYLSELDISDIAQYAFRSKAEYLLALSMAPQLKKLPCSVQAEFFHCHRFYINDYDIRCEDRELLVTINFANVNTKIEDRILFISPDGTEHYGSGDIQVESTSKRWRYSVFNGNWKVKYYISKYPDKPLINCSFEFNNREVKIL